MAGLITIGARGGDRRGQLALAAGRQRRLKVRANHALKRQPPLTQVRFPDWSNRLLARATAQLSVSESHAVVLRGRVATIDSLCACSDRTYQ